MLEWLHRISDPSKKSDILLGPAVDKGLLDHLVETALVDTDCPATGAAYLVALDFRRAEQLVDAVLMASEDFTVAELFVFPELLPAGGSGWSAWILVSLICSPLLLCSVLFALIRK